MRPEILLKMAEGLGVSTDYLLTGDIIDKGLLLLSKKLSVFASRQFRRIEIIVDDCIN